MQYDSYFSITTCLLQDFLHENLRKILPVEKTHDDERNSKCKNTKESIDDRGQATRSD